MESQRIDQLSSTVAPEVERRDFKSILDGLSQLDRLSQQIKRLEDQKAGREESVLASIGPNETSIAGSAALVQQAEVYYGRDLDGNGAVGTVGNVQQGMRGLELVMGRDVDQNGSVGTVSAVATSTGTSTAPEVTNFRTVLDGLSSIDSLANQITRLEDQRATQLETVLDLIGPNETSLSGSRTLVERAEVYYSRDLDGNGAVGTVAEVSQGMRGFELVFNKDVDGNGTTGSIGTTPNATVTADTTPAATNTPAATQGSTQNSTAPTNPSTATTSTATATTTPNTVAETNSGNANTGGGNQETGTGSNTGGNSQSNSEASTTPTSTANTPASSATEVPDVIAATGRVWGDPHFEDPDGGTFDIQGEAGKYYNLLSDRGIQVNGLFEQYADVAGVNIVSRLGISIDGGTGIEIKSNGDAFINGRKLTNNETVTFEGGSISKAGNIITVTSGEYSLQIERVDDPVATNKDYLNITFNSTDVTTDNVMPHGLWGQTVDGDGQPRVATDSQGTGAIQGRYSDYEVSGLFDLDFAAGDRNGMRDATGDKNLSRAEVATALEALEIERRTDFDWNGTIGDVASENHLTFALAGAEWSLNEDLDMNGSMGDVTNLREAIEGAEARLNKDLDGDGIVGRTENGRPVETGGPVSAVTPSSVATDPIVRGVENLEIQLRTDFDWNGVIGGIESTSFLAFPLRGAEFSTNRDLDGNGQIGVVDNLQAAINGAEAFLNKDLDGNGTVGGASLG